MAEYDLMLQTVRLHVKKKDTLMFIGFFRDDNPEGRVVRVLLDDKELPVDITIREGLEIRRKYLPYNSNVSQEIVGEVSLPDGWEQATELKIVSSSEDEDVAVFRVSGKEVKKFAQEITGNLDYVRIEEDGVHLGGWIAAGEEASFAVYDGERQVGVTTSGTHCSYVNHAVAMARIEKAAAEPGKILEVEVRGRRVEAKIVPLPFYKRA